MPKTIALEDDSLFILSGFYNGVSHPPGYPLYTLILYLFTHIPFIENVAAKAHASSAFFGALTCGSLFLIFNVIGLRKNTSAILTLSFAASSTIWSQSLITEVYSLNSFLNASSLLLSLKIYQNFLFPRTNHLSNSYLFYLLALMTGLALANHWPLTIIALPCYAILTIRSFISQKNKLTILCIFFTSLTLPYIYLYFNNQSSPLINFSGGFDSFQDFINFILRTHYSSVDNKETAGLYDKAQFSFDLIKQIASDLNILLILSIFGIYRLFKENKTVVFSILWLFFSNSFLLVIMLNFDYSELYSLVFKVYPIVAIFSLFVLGGYGVYYINIKYPSEQVLIIWVIVVIIPINLFISLPQNYRHNYIWGQRYAEQILSTIPNNSFLFSDGEIELGITSYLQKIQRVRPDIVIYSSSALLLSNRLFSFDLKDKKKHIDTLVKNAPNNNYYVANNYYSLNTISSNLFTSQLGFSNKPAKTSITKNDLDLILKWSHSEDNKDPWTAKAIQGVRQKSITILTQALVQTNDKSSIDFYSSYLDKLILSDSDRLIFLIELTDDIQQFNKEFVSEQFTNISFSSLRNKQEKANFIYIEEIIFSDFFTEEIRISAQISACKSWETLSNTHCKEVFKSQN